MGINLSKGQKIDLTKKDGSSLSSFCVGANWGAISSKGFFGGDKKVAVDLDLSVGIYGVDKNLINSVYFGNLEYDGVKHSGDDLTGDIDGDDGLDNEVIQINLNNVPSDVNQIVFLLNSYQQQDFATIPFASIRLYEGTPENVDEVIATYNVAQDAKFKGYVAMVLGKLYKKNGAWKFSAIGDVTSDRKLQALLETVKDKFL